MLASNESIMKSTYPIVGTGRRAVATGEKRAPYKGELYLSGAIVEAYTAPNDLSSEFYIAEAVDGDTKWRVYAGKSYLREFDTKTAARAYALGVVKESHPNIGNVELVRYTSDDCSEYCEFVESFGYPVTKTQSRYVHFHISDCRDGLKVASVYDTFKDRGWIQSVGRSYGEAMIKLQIQMKCFDFEEYQALLYPSTVHFGRRID